MPTEVVRGVPASVRTRGGTYGLFSTALGYAHYHLACVNPREATGKSNCLWFQTRQQCDVKTE